MSTGKQVICPLDWDVIFRQPTDREGLADSSMMVHVDDAANTYNSIIIGPVDSNVLVLIVYVFGQLDTK